MSDLDDLGEIADQCALGSSGLSAKHTGKRPAQRRCGSPGHMKGENVGVRPHTKGTKLRTYCKLCDKARRRQPAYSAQGYPL